MGCFGCLEASVGPSLEFGGIIDFTGSDLAEGQLSDGLCKTMDRRRPVTFRPRYSSLNQYSLSIIKER